MKPLWTAMQSLSNELRTNEEFTSPRGLGAVGAGGWFLGMVVMGGFQIALWSDEWFHVGVYLLSLGVFHTFEFFLTALWNSETLSYNSYLLNHSPEYHYALGGSIVEFVIEALLFPSINKQRWITQLGILIAFTGQAIRTIAMWEAKGNFTHQIAEERKDDHVLVTDGIYRMCRHPSYCGWFWWALGTQLILVNPVCAVAYALVAWKFFRIRIKIEEEFLVQFFEDDYLRYRTQVWSGIPGIDGVWMPSSLGLSTVFSAFGVASQSRA
ncbi:hypothetical protein AAMO2058_000492100 [Amorphochlora amoebiformis]